MKKLFFTLGLAAMGVMTLSAQETIKTLYEGDPVNVTWENTLSISAEDFADQVNIGDYIYIKFSETTDVIELKADGTWLPGTKYTYLGDSTTDLRTYITADMLSRLKQYGLELCGASFTVTEVSICNDGFNMPDGAIWGGYFWVDNWNTLELFKTAFDYYNNQEYMIIYLSDDNGDNDSYFMKVLTAWDNDDAIWANNDDIYHEPKVAVVSLKDIDVKTALEGVNTLMIQSNPEGGNPYNITAVALAYTEDIESGANSVKLETSVENGDIYNLQGMLVKKNASLPEDLSNLPAGIYIVNGKKYQVK